jgi:uncharacterized protein (UPF0297 family)
MENTNEGRFILEESIEMDVKEIMFGVTEKIQDYANQAIKQWIAYRRRI